MDKPFYERKKIFKNIDENTVIEILLNSKSSDGKSDLRTFFNIIYYPVSHEEFMGYKGFYVTKNILREELKLTKGNKPGDIDVIIIPFNENKIFFERTAVYEVKIVRPTRKNPTRNANSLGITQLKGLIKDGFPLVSLIHASITEPLLEEEKMDVKYSSIPANSGITPKKGKTYEDYLFDVKLDHFSWWSSDNQIRRLLAQGIPEFAGINSVGLDFGDDGSISWCSPSVGYENFTKGSFNPNTIPNIILKIKLHFKKYRFKYIQILQ